MPEYDDVIANTLISNINTRVQKDYLSKWKKHCKEEKKSKLYKEKAKQWRQRNKDVINYKARLYRCNNKERVALQKKAYKFRKRLQSLSSAASSSPKPQTLNPKP